MINMPMAQQCYINVEMQYIYINKYPLIDNDSKAQE